MIENFLEQLMIKLNLVKNGFNVYYEEAPNNIDFPYAVVSTLSISTLDYGLQCIVDIEFYANEINATNIENICDLFRKSLDCYSYQNSIFGYYLRFDNQILTKQNEQDITYRRMSFIAKIF